MAKVIDVILIALVIIYVRFLLQWYIEILIQKEVKRQLNFNGIDDEPIDFKKPVNKTDNKKQSKTKP